MEDLERTVREGNLEKMLREAELYNMISSLTKAVRSLQSGGGTSIPVKQIAEKVEMHEDRLEFVTRVSVDTKMKIGAMETRLKKLEGGDTQHSRTWHNTTKRQR